MKNMWKTFDITHIVATAILAGVGLVVVLILRNEANLYWKTKVSIEEKVLFSQAVDTCLQAGKVSWVEDGVTTEIPHQPTFENCLSKKGY